MKTIRVVAAVIKAVNKSGEPIIFATQRGYGEFKGGWEFPGGKIEAGETPQEALKREIKEELETEITVGELIDTVEYDYPNFHLSMDCFWCEIVSGDLVLKEHKDAKWLKKEELDSVEWLPADITLVEKIRWEMNETLAYYNANAETFVKGTVDVDFAKMQNMFLSKLKKGAHILDFGCGSGRDTKYFLEQGYHVDAIDGSGELCKLACAYTGIDVKHMLFQQLDQVNKYDGIWACSSILHLPVIELQDVMGKMAIALKKYGIIYTSFKYGTYAGERNGRYFTDMTEETFAAFLDKIKELQIEEQWITSDVRPGRGEEKWLNLILRKR